MNDWGASKRRPSFVRRRAAQHGDFLTLLGLLDPAVTRGRASCCRRCSARAVGVLLGLCRVNGAAVNGVEMIGGQMVTNVLLSQKIFTSTCRVAITSFIALAFAGHYAVRFLMTKNRRFDTCSEDSDGDRALFVACTMITGDLWTRFEWGVVDVGSAPDDVPHPHAHHHRVLHPAQRHRRA